jgi:hypothetical protein
MKYIENTIQSRELHLNEIQQVYGGLGLDPCEVPSIESFGGKSAGVGAISLTVGATSGSSAVATRFGIIGAALTVAFMAGWSIGVGINQLIGQCDAE